LSELHRESCLDLRQLAARHGVDAANETLARAIADLRRRGKISRIGGRGRRASFVAATFES
jgi:DNA-binding GntR family transcriptional regulator